MVCARMYVCMFRVLSGLQAGGWWMDDDDVMVMHAWMVSSVVVLLSFIPVWLVCCGCVAVAVCVRVAVWPCASPPLALSLSLSPSLPCSIHQLIACWLPVAGCRLPIWE